VVCSSIRPTSQEEETLPRKSAREETDLIIAKQEMARPTYPFIFQGSFTRFEQRRDAWTDPIKCLFAADLCGSWLQHDTYRWCSCGLLSPLYLFFVYDLTDRWRCSGGEARLPPSPSSAREPCAQIGPPPLLQD